MSWQWFSSQDCFCGGGGGGSTGSCDPSCFEDVRVISYNWQGQQLLPQSLSLSVKSLSLMLSVAAGAGAFL